MAGLAPLLLLRLSLSTCCVLLLLLLAACPSLAIGPCQVYSRITRFNDFKDQHLPQGWPTNTLDKNDLKWSKFINAMMPNCDRPTQSFLFPDTQDQVEAVCSDQGGKVYKDNFCISKKQFKFVTVRTVKGKDSECEIKSIKKENKHLILACDKVDNQCLPVHFEGNPNNNKPKPKALACQAP